MAGIRSHVAALLLGVLLAGCGGPAFDTVSLYYEPTHSLVPGPGHNVVGIGAVIDARGAAPDALGKARDKLGLREETLVSEPAVSRAVAAAFTDALMARGLLAPPGKARFELVVRILGLDAEQRWGRRAAADFAVSLRRRPGGRVVYTGEAVAAGRGSGPFSLDPAAYVPVAGIGELVQASMNEAIDQALDNPGFRAAISR